MSKEGGPHTELTNVRMSVSGEGCPQTPDILDQCPNVRLRGRLSTDTWLTRPMSKCPRLGRVVHRHLTDLTNVQMSMSKEGFSFSHTYLTIVRMFVSGEGCPQTPDILDQCPNVRLRGRLFTDNWNTWHMSKHPCPGWVARKHLTDLTNVQICVSQILQ